MGHFAAVDQCRLLSCYVLLVLCRTRRRTAVMTPLNKGQRRRRRIREKATVTPTVAAAAARMAVDHDAACDPTETDRDSFGTSRHSDSDGLGQASETSSV
jgi:hypothetical protein